MCIHFKIDYVLVSFSNLIPTSEKNGEAENNTTIKFR